MKSKERLFGLVIVVCGIFNLCGFQELFAGNDEQSVFTDPVTGMAFLRVKGGCFRMGSVFSQGENDEKPAHRVCVDDYHIGKYEVTVGEFRRFVDETGYQTDAEREGNCFGLDKDGNWDVVSGKSWKNLSFNQQENHPVVCVSWNDAQAFTAWLRQKTAGGYRLLTEAEWEYAARSRGERRMFATRSGHLSRKLANYGPEVCCAPDDSDGNLYTASVGSYPANNIGVFDMSGNVWEWTADWYDADYYVHSPQENPKGPVTGKYRVIRGGAWNIPGRYSRCSNRREVKPTGRHVNHGFRLAKDIQ